VPALGLGLLGFLYVVFSSSGGSSLVGAQDLVWVLGSWFFPLFSAPGLRFLSLVSLVCSWFDVCLDSTLIGSC
jgi:hypothetical protein